MEKISTYMFVDIIKKVVSGPFRSGARGWWYNPRAAPASAKQVHGRASALRLWLCWCSGSRLRQRARSARAAEVALVAAASSAIAASSCHLPDARLKSRRPTGYANRPTLLLVVLHTLMSFAGFCSGEEFSDGVREIWSRPRDVRCSAARPHFVWFCREGFPGILCQHVRSHGANNDVFN